MKALHGYKPQLGDIEDTYRENAFFVAFLTTYAKCFVNTGSRVVKLDPGAAFKGATHAAKTHARIMELRHTYAAHNDPASGLVRSTIAVKEEPGGFAIKHLVTLALPVNEIEEFSLYFGCARCICRASAK